MKPAEQRFSKRGRPLVRNAMRARLGRRSFAGSGSLWIRKPELRAAAIRLPMALGDFA
jgi:hypothetical protein